jgi:hypothetical protein
MKKQKPIKIRRSWGNINPIERVVPKKRIEDEPFDPSFYRGLQITEEDLDELGEE